MECMDCGTALVVNHRPRLWKESGWGNVVVMNGETRMCPACGAEERVFYKLGPLVEEVERARASVPDADVGHFEVTLADDNWRAVHIPPVG